MQILDSVALKGHIKERDREIERQQETEEYCTAGV